MKRYRVHFHESKAYVQGFYRSICGTNAKQVPNYDSSEVDCERCIKRLERFSKKEQEDAVPVDAT